MKRLLLIAYYFPPDGGAGAQRPAKFCRYLPECGWDVTVLTRAVQSDADRGRWDPADSSLSRDVEGLARILRIPARDGWLDHLFASACEEVRRQRYDCVLITMSPFSLAYVGHRLRTKLDVPIVYDLRDPWCLDGWQRQPTYWHWRREMRLMRASLSEADGVIANTPEAARRIREVIPELEGDRLSVIPNGYDREDFRRASSPAPASVSRTFTLVHTGTLHGEVLYRDFSVKGVARRILAHSPERIIRSGRTVQHLLGAVRRLKKEDAECADKLRIVLVGQADEGTLRCIASSSLGSIVSTTGFVTHTESVHWLMKADGLFLPLHDLPHGGRSLIVPGKTYEYLASARPILGCLPAGDAHDLVAASGVGYLSRPTDEPAICESLHRMVRDWAGTPPRQREPAPWVSAYERRELARRLAEFLERVRNARKQTARRSLRLAG
jgi:glycosyltransferase involved in cell wall biosynthesis